MAISFDSVNNRIVLDSAFADTKDVYGAWKVWAATGDNLKFLPAFRVVGGDPLSGNRSVPTYLFLTNGWRIRPMESDHTLHITGGQISVEGGGDPVVPTLGAHNVLVDREVPVAAIGVAEGGGGSVSANEIAAAVLAALQSTTIPVNIKKVNDITVTGTGVEGNTWGPA